MQICEKEPVTPVATRKSPRKLHRNTAETYQPIEVNNTVTTRKSPRKLQRNILEASKPIETNTAVVPSHLINIDILHQDWNDDTEDMSTNIQEILDGLSVDDAIDSPKKSVFKVETKENDAGAVKLFPLFNKDYMKTGPSLL